MKVFLLFIYLLSSYADTLSGNDSNNLKSVLNRIQYFQKSKDNISNVFTNGELRLQCIDTKGNDTYIGLEHSLIVHSAYENVARELDNFENYASLFPDMKHVSVKEKSDGLATISFEQKPLLFFLPSTKYESKYQILSCGEFCKIYRFKLQNSNMVKNSDGFILIAKKDESSTYYVGLDFFDANWGLLKAVPKSKIWLNSVQGFYKSDLSIKLKLEKNISYKDAQKEAAKIASSIKLDQCNKGKLNSEEFALQ